MIPGLRAILPLLGKLSLLIIPESGPFSFSSRPQTAPIPKAASWPPPTVSKDAPRMHQDVAPVPFSAPPTAPHALASFAAMAPLATFIVVYTLNRRSNL